MSKKKLNRRQFLLSSAAGAAGIVVASCAGPTAAPPPAPVAATATEVGAPPTSEAIKAVEATNTPVPTTEATHKSDRSHVVL